MDLHIYYKYTQLCEDILHLHGHIVYLYRVVSTYIRLRHTCEDMYYIYTHLRRDILDLRVVSLIYITHTDSWMEI